MDVLVVGIDACCEGVIDPLRDDGVIPTLSELFEDGVSGPLESHVPPWTPSMWPSIYTGVNPGKHGIFSFLDYDGYDWDIVNASHRRERPIWQLLDERGHSSVVVNVPVTHPPDEFDGALIPGYTAPEDPDCHPNGTLDEVEAALGREYQIYPDFENGTSPVVDEYRSLVRLRGEAFRFLAEEYDPDFGFVQFQQTDTVFHRHPDDLELVRDIYEAVDEEVASILDAQDPDVVLVVSDHGMGEYDGCGFRVNTFLEEQGYVEATYGEGGMPTWAVGRETTLSDGHEAVSDGLGDRMIDWSLGAASSVGLTTRRVGRALEQVGLHDTVAGMVPDRVIRSGQRQVDFAASTAYMRARIELGVRINLAGRDPEGVVDPEDYEDVRAELIELLEDVETPSGDPAFEEVVPRDAYFEGPAVDGAVDIITVPADFDHFLSADLLDDTFGPPGQPWNHKRDGIVGISGDGVDATESVSDAHVFDVAPTILAAMDMETSQRMDGDVLPPVTGVGEGTYAAPADGGPSPNEDPEMVDRLRELGYLDQ